LRQSPPPSSPPAPLYLQGHRGSAYARLERDEEAVSAFHTALDMAHATGNAALAEEIETRLVRGSAA